METATKKISAKDLEILQSSRVALLANTIFNPEILQQINSNTVWEELTCIGYNPQISRLEAVVSIKQATGYSGDLCSTGSTEYVRFFIDWYNTGIYTDLGIASFKVADISDAPAGAQHPLQYMAYLKVEDKFYRRYCRTPLLPKIRAVLSWNTPPSANPFIPPVFGNAREARIQIAARTIFDQFFGVDKLVNIQKSLNVSFNEKPVSDTLLSAIEPVSWSELKENYAKLEVPDHRLFFEAVHPLIKQGPKISPLAAQKDMFKLKEFKINFKELAESINALKFNTTYEDITCVGLNTATDMLGAVIRIKRPGGYSGNLCNGGSFEYVNFWADWDNDGNFDQFLGTASVKVYDIPTVGSGNELFYCVSLPFDVKKHLRSCGNPNVIKIRAVLSWATPASTTDPNDPAPWGNILDALVQIRPGQIGTDLVPLIEAISGVTLDTIDINPLSTSYGLGNSTSILTGDNYNTFGGTVYITGEFLNSGPSKNVKYRIQFNDGSGWQPVTGSQTYLKEFPTLPTTYAYETQTPPDGWFEYIPDNTTVGVVNKTLASWSTGSKFGVHRLRIQYTLDKVSIFTQVFSAIRLNNTDFVKSPTANTVVDPGSTFDLVIDGGDCHSYDDASPIINGHLRVLHEYFGYWTLVLEPATHTHGVTPSPTSRACFSLSDVGDGNFAWTLDTSLLDKCGYTVTLRGYDRTIVNGSLGARHQDSKSVGFAVL
jgi:hypothetical protein